MLATLDTPVQHIDSTIGRSRILVKGAGRGGGPFYYKLMGKGAGEGMMPRYPQITDFSLQFSVKRGDGLNMPHPELSTLNLSGPVYTIEIRGVMGKME